MILLPHIKSTAMNIKKHLAVLIIMNLPVVIANTKNFPKHQFQATYLKVSIRIKLTI